MGERKEIRKGWNKGGGRKGERKDEKEKEREEVGRWNQISFSNMTPQICGFHIIYYAFSLRDVIHMRDFKEK